MTTALESLGQASDLPMSAPIPEIPSHFIMYSVCGVVKTVFKVVFLCVMICA